MEKKFFEAISGQRYAELFYILLYTGMRIGEACALEWKDIDFIIKPFPYLKHYSERNSMIGKIKNCGKSELISLLQSHTQVNE